MKLHLKWGKSLARRLVQALLAIGTTVGFVAALIPTIGSWFANHGTLGWLLFFLALAGLAATIGQVEVSAPKAAAPEVGAEDTDASAPEIAGLRLQRDLEALQERMHDWGINSDFHSWLVEDINHTRFPSDRFDELINRESEWQIDSRQLNDDELEAAFSAMSAALSDYTQMLSLTTSPVEGAWNYNGVDGRLRHSDPDRFDKDHEKLNTGRVRLIERFGDFYSLLHRRGISLLPSGR